LRIFPRTGPEVWCTGNRARQLSHVGTRRQHVLKYETVWCLAWGKQHKNERKNPGPSNKKLQKLFAKVSPCQYMLQKGASECKIPEQFPQENRTEKFGTLAREKGYKKAFTSFRYNPEGKIRDAC